MHRRTLMAAALVGGLPRVAGAASTPVVLELFTSQGCSSCPPADALLGQLTRRPGVIALAWHVDYWNHLGWRDPYASKDATQRQQAYARNLGGDVFTPALVINGALLVVGSDRSAVESAIAATHPRPAAVTLARGADGLVAEIVGSAGPLRASLVIYDPEHVTAVGSGENGGAHLREYRVVREARLIAEWDGTARRLELPEPGPGQGAVLLLQSADLRIVGAADAAPV